MDLGNLPIPSLNRLLSLPYQNQFLLLVLSKIQMLSETYLRIVILKLMIILLYLHTPPLPYLLIMAEILKVYSFQKDSFSHANLTKANTDVHIILDDNAP